MQQDTSSRNQAANDMESLIPEYRSSLARMKKQVDELHSKLEDACCERDSLQQQVCPIVQPVSPHMLLFVQLSLPCSALQLHQHQHQLVMAVCFNAIPVLKQPAQQLHIAQSAGLLFPATVPHKIESMTVLQKLWHVAGGNFEEGCQAG